MTIFAPIIGGWLVDAVSFELVFSIFAVAGALSLLVFIVPMREPTPAPVSAAIAD